MSKSVEQLIMALTQEYQIYRDYLDLAKKKKTMIIEGNIKEIDNMTKIEQNVIVNIGKIDRIRTAIIGNLLRELNVDSVENITALTEHLPEPVKAKIVVLKDKLGAVLQEIKEVNELNAKLIEHSLEYIDYSLNLVSSVDNKGSIYSSKADERDVKIKTNLFDAKI